MNPTITIPIPITFMVFGTTPEQRLSYRLHRAIGYDRHSANLIVYGMMVQAGNADAIEWIITFADGVKRRVVPTT